MFTGIIEAIGTIEALQPAGGDYSVKVAVGSLDMADVCLGDSIAVNGVCLTVTALTAKGFSADVSLETVRHTCFSDYRAGRKVNLEKALLPTSRMGGHIVSGHVDGVGTILDRREDGRAVRFRVQAPSQLLKYIADKGSITIDGTSLTVNSIKSDVFELNIVPHTLAGTVLEQYHAGQKVHLEVDLVARYLERLISQPSEAKSESNLSLEFLAQHGFNRA
ncbi:riboflavin synthase alpha chain [Oceanospirillum multiglobuliferum]|uniref:Riboflavin synthase n=1 Tax=Oceanospirillum multiglobuliferum TaxID=64969 RepID=A0A1T4S3U2_9GAMM|nr:riboflavin synthase [Oceanospirillum multiglobuliferum]OPX54509.1 riboflavin synthase [Oceanospirillum multiglobuliferum]SKA22776.1 riboflavin synthase alpha chain [Oceanospirillum multiglobuliferum]